MLYAERNAMTSLGKGANYAIVREDGIVRARVWMRPDLTSAEGAQCAEEIAAHLTRESASVASKSLILDVSATAPIFGPRTEAALSGLIKLWISSHKPVEVVIGTSSMQGMQWRRVVEMIGGNVAVRSVPDPSM